MQRRDHLIQVKKIMQLVPCEYVLINTYDKLGNPICYRQNEHENIPDNILNKYSCEFSTYYQNICGKTHAIINLLIYWD